MPMNERKFSPLHLQQQVTIGQWLKLARLEKGWNPPQMAREMIKRYGVKAVGANVTTILHVESGKYHTGYKTIGHMAATLDLDPLEVLRLGLDPYPAEFYGDNKEDVD